MVSSLHDLHWYSLALLQSKTTQFALRSPLTHPLANGGKGTRSWGSSSPWEELNGIFFCEFNCAQHPTCSRLQQAWWLLCDGCCRPHWWCSSFAKIFFHSNVSALFILYLVWYPLLLGLACLDSIISVLVMVRFHDLISKSPVNVYQSTERGSWKYIMCQTTNEQTKGEHPLHVVLLMIFTFTATIRQFPHQISPVCLLVHLKHCLKPNNEIDKQRERLQVWEAWKASLWRWVWLLVCENCLFLIPKLSISFLTTHQHSFLYTITTTL